MTLLSSFQYVLQNSTLLTVNCLMTWLLSLLSLSHLSLSAHMCIAHTHTYTFFSGKLLFIEIIVICTIGIENPYTRKSIFLFGIPDEGKPTRLIPTWYHQAIVQRLNSFRCYMPATLHMRGAESSKLKPSGVNWD